MQFTFKMPVPGNTYSPFGTHLKYPFSEASPASLRDPITLYSNLSQAFSLRVVACLLVCTSLKPGCVLFGGRQHILFMSISPVPQTGPHPQQTVFVAWRGG